MEPVKAQRSYMSAETPEDLARELRIENERKANELIEKQRAREIDQAREQGREQERLERRLTDHDEKFKVVETSLAIQTDRLEKIEKAFGEFTAVAKALAENGVSNRTFILGVGMLLIAIIGLFIGVAHP